VRLKLIAVAADIAATLLSARDITTNLNKPSSFPVQSEATSSENPWIDPTTDPRWIDPVDQIQTGPWTIRVKGSRLFGSYYWIRFVDQSTTLVHKIYFYLFNTQFESEFSSHFTNQNFSYKTSHS